MIDSERREIVKERLLNRFAKCIVIGEAILMKADTDASLRLEGIVEEATKILLLRGGAGPGEALPPFVSPEESAEADRLSRELTGRILALKAPKEEP